jgi:hypothetical protein
MGAGQPSPERAAFDPDPYRPLTRRRRLLVLLLAVATAVTVVLVLLHPPGGVQRRRALPQPCAEGQTSGCVGGKVDVIVAPAPAPASAPR